MKMISSKNLLSSLSCQVLIILILMSVKTSGKIQFSGVTIARNGETVCAGSMKNTKTVLTAASCVRTGNPKEYTVVLDSETNETAQVKDIIINVDWDGREENNIAVLRLVSGAKWSDGRPVRIKGRLTTQVYNEKVLQLNPRCVVLDEKHKRGIEVEVVPNSICSKKLSRTIVNTQICVSRKLGQKKKCPSGAGNPIVCKLRAGQWAQIGIHIDNDCQSQPMIASRISKFRPWLRKALGINRGDLDGKDSGTDFEGNSGGDYSGSSRVDSRGDSRGNIDPDSDKAEPEEVCHNETEFRCSNGTCISMSQVCDGKVDCPCGREDENACGCDLAGTEFITGFFTNFGPEVSILYITAPVPTSVTVTIPFLGYRETRSIHQTEKWSFDNTSLIISESSPGKGVHIVADKPVTVIAANSREFSYSTVDGTIVYPLLCLSNYYQVETQQHKIYRNSQYAVIGTIKGNTDINIVNKAGRVITATLGYLDAFFLQEKDLRGTTIQATHNVVVLSGSKCGFVPPEMATSCDHLVNQVPPTSSYGKFYIVTQQKPRKGFYIRIKAAEDSTTIVIRYTSGSIYETKTIDSLTDYAKLFLDRKPLSIEADKGIMVTQYALDATIDGIGQGDPSMIMLPSLNQFSTLYNFAVPDHFLRISVTIYVSSCHDPSGFLLNGAPVSPCGMETVVIPGYGEYNVLNIDLDTKWDVPGYATLRHAERDVSFAAIMYGTRVEGAFAWRIGGTL